MFNKKFYLVCMAVLVSVSLFVIGCPTEAEDGLPGQKGENGTTPPFQGSAGGNTATADDLDTYFNDLEWDVLVLPTDVYSVYGTVPKTKTLVVVGLTGVTVGESLTVEGTLVVRANTMLYASYDGSAGYLVSTGTITGDGSLVLPFFAGTAKPDTNVVAFGGDTGTVKQAVGSYNTAVATAAPAGALSPANIATLFATNDALTAGGFSGLDATAIPLGKKLTLTSYNSLATGLDLTGKGTLIVAEGATLSTGGSGGAVKGDITIEKGGTLTLAIAADSVGAGVTNNGIISVEAALSGTSAATALLGVAGSGTVVFGDPGNDSGDAVTPISNTLTIAAKVDLKQKVVIRNSATLTVAGAVAVPFSSAAAPAAQSAALAVGATPSKPITIDAGGKLVLPLAVTSLGVAVENNGTISTQATGAPTVTGLLTLLDATGDGVIELAAGANLASVKLDVQDVRIASGQTLTVSGETPFSGTKRIINAGTLSLTAATSIGVKVINDATGTVTTGATTALNAVVADIDLSTAGNALILSGVITTPVTIDSKGTVTFTNTTAPVFGPVSSIKAANINFDEGFASSTGDVSLDGAVSIPTGKNIRFGAGTITLEAETVISNRETGDGPVAVLSASDATKLTGSTNAQLAIAADGITISGGAVTFDGPVAFEGGLTLTAVGATFNGNVSFKTGKAITMSAAQSVVTLGPGVYLGITPAANVPAVYTSVIHNPNETTGNVVLTPEANTTLTLADTEDTPRTITQSGTGSTHGIKIGGTASLPAGATYVVGTTSGTLTLGADAELSLAAGVLGESATVDATYDHDGSSSKLVLTGVAESAGAKLAGAGVLKAGKTTITGASGGSWQAVGASSDTTISVDKIVTTAALTATGANAAITVTAGTLDLTGTVKLASSAGSVNLAGDGTNAGVLRLKGDANSNPGTLAIGTETTDVTTFGTVTRLTDSTGTAATAVVITGTGYAAKASNANVTTADTTLGSISGGDTATTKDAILTGPTAVTSTIVTGWEIIGSST